MIDFLVSQQLLTIFVVLALGAALGQVSFGPLRFGAAGALFVGLAVGALSPQIGSGLAILQTLGLALFVYTVGVAAGGTFVTGLRTQWPMMLVGVGVLVVAAGTALAAGGLLGLDIGLIAGAFAGALTSTPALAAAAQATGSPDAAVGYSLGYPVGVVLAIIAVALVVGRGWPGRRDTPSLAGAGIQAVTTVVERSSMLSQVPGWTEQKIKMSYLHRGDRTSVIGPDTTLQVGDEVLVVGPPAEVAPAVDRLGHAGGQDLRHNRTDVDFRYFLVSNPSLAGQSVAELDLPGRLDGIATRIKRGDLEMLARDELVIQPGDRVMAVVPRHRMDAASEFFGDSERRISEIDVLATGVGMALGLLLGIVAIPVGGGASFSLGAAAGPLIVGMTLGALHRTGPLVWDLPQAANLTIRQIGLLLFLAVVGLASGPQFVKAMTTAAGVNAGLLAAVVILVTCAAFLVATRLMGLSAARASGGLAGLVGQPAILSYATSRVTDERVESGYAALFALGIITKIVLVQVMARL